MPKYRSRLEERVAAALPDDWEYEPAKYPYIIERNYMPDFVKAAESKTVGPVWIECKGYLAARTQDVSKYKAIRKCYPDIRIIFVWENPFAKVRKGAKMTNAKWCEANGFEWTTPSDIEEEGIV